MSRHDDAESQVSTWLHDEAEGELPDWVLDDTFQSSRETEQQRGLRGRLWAATNSRSMHQGRTMMFTMPKLAAVIAVTALTTAAVVGVSLQSDPAAPAGAQADRALAAEFSGETQFGDCFGPEPAIETSPGFVREAGVPGTYCTNPAHEEFTDPRLQGEFRVWGGSSDSYGLGPTIRSDRFSMHDDDGAWVQRPNLTLSHTDGSGPNEVVVMEGSGAYEGLNLIAEVSFFDGVWTWRGYIVEGDLPAAPEVELPE
jgi:hypothetical protein